MAKVDISTCKKRLAAVMAQLEIQDYTCDYTQQEGWVIFAHNGQTYRLLHSASNAAGNGQPVSNGIGALWQIILTLDDLARASNHGICDLQTWIEGTLIALPCVHPVESKTVHIVK